MSDNAYNKAFDAYACVGDSIDCQRGELTFRATIAHDDEQPEPWENDEGFWPSRDPSAAGYCPPERFDQEQAKAERVAAAWRAADWSYCGVVVSVWVDDICLDQHAASLWCVELNYPDSDNAYLTEVANELLDEAAEVAHDKLAKLAAASLPATLAPEHARNTLAAVGEPWNVADALEHVASSYRDAVGELAAAWQDDEAGKAWGDIANALERAAKSCRKACKRRGLN